MFEVGNLKGGGLGPLPKKPVPYTASGCLGDCIHCDQICEGPGREQSLQPNWNSSSNRGASRANFCPCFWSMKSFLKSRAWTGTDQVCHCRKILGTTEPNLGTTGDNRWLVSVFRSLSCPFLLNHPHLWKFGSKQVLVTESYLTVCNPVNYSPPGLSVHGILQARKLEWVPIPFSRGSPQPRDWTRVASCIAGIFFTRKALDQSKEASKILHTLCRWTRDFLLDLKL